MTSFAARMKPAAELEAKVLEHLNQTGYEAFPFGQAQLSERCRQLLFRYEDGSGRPCLIRWMPDIITVRVGSDGSVWVALIDAKYCSDKWDNYSLEMSAVETAEHFADRMYTPTFFVFNGGKVLTPRTARQRGRPGPPLRNGSSGSDTPYLLVDKAWGRPFDEFFPPVIPTMRPASDDP
jgi:hypothetical protein